MVAHIGRSRNRSRRDTFFENNFGPHFGSSSSAKRHVALARGNRAYLGAVRRVVITTDRTGFLRR